MLVQYAIRSNENTRRTWTLISLAVRIAHALGLHRERSGGRYASPYLPFEREMRRRLWWQICVLDRQASADRGSDPIITTNSFSTPFPLHVNDEDLLPDDPHEVQPREEYTDITMSLVCHEVFDIERRLNYVPAGEYERPRERTEDTWAQRRGWVSACQRRVEDKYLRHCDMNIPLQRHTLLVGRIIISTMWLFAYRPLQRHPDSRTSAEIPHPGLLHLSVEVIEKTIQIAMDSSTGPFSWISTIWVQWHALAVMIAELCVQTEGQTVERAWQVVETVFEETSRHVADSDKGRLWRPIKKLMNKAQEVRRKHLEHVATITRSLANGGPPTPWMNTQPSDVNKMTTEAEPKLVADHIKGTQQLHQGVMSTEPLLSINWDQSPASGQSDRMDYNNELTQLAWGNWETFIDDFQDHGDFLPGQENGMQPSVNMWYAPR
jgi:Fungal specific transcription factor domain